MIKFIAAISILILLVACSAGEAIAAQDGMKCGNVWINRGDNILKVLTNCGEPKLLRESVDNKGNTATRLFYSLYGATYIVRLRNDTVVNVKWSRE